LIRFPVDEDIRIFKIYSLSWSIGAKTALPVLNSAGLIPPDSRV
jgi:hypothetical protein